MTEPRQHDSSIEPPEAGVGGEGPITDLSVLAPTTDGEIADAVRAAFVLDPDVEANRFTVEVSDGAVRLASELSPPHELRRAREIARRVPNVQSVSVTGG